VTYLVETTQGSLISGLLVSRTDKEVVLKDGQSKELRIPAEDVELIAPQQKSLMPELLVRDMTAQQLADLLALLQSLK
jgi:putative heme-binding domain-containing protein